MFEVNYKPLLKSSLLFVILAQGLCLPVPGTITNSTKKIVGANEGIPLQSSAAIHERIKKDKPEIKSDIESIVEAPVDVVGPKSVETESHSKVQKKRESKDGVEDSRPLNIRDCKLQNDDEVKGGKYDAEAGLLNPHFSRFHGHGEQEGYDVDCGNVGDGRNSEGEQDNFPNVIATDDEEDEEEDGRVGTHKDNLDDDDFHYNLKRDGRHEIQPKIWDQWGKWTCCSVSCGMGKLTRWRHCVAGGCSSGEKEAQLKGCERQIC